MYKSKGYHRSVKCKPPCPAFEFGSLRQFSTTIITTTWLHPWVVLQVLSLDSIFTKFCTRQHFFISIFIFICLMFFCAENSLQYYVFTNPSSLVGCDTRSIFKWGFNKFSFFYSCCLTKAKETSLPYYLP